MTTTISSFLSSLVKTGIARKQGKDAVLRVLTKLGLPQDKYPTIHVAGTNGKGSTSMVLSSCLHAAGYRVGLFTGPNLVSLNERIRINQEPVSMELLEAYAEELPGIIAQEEEPLTYVETLTVLAFLTFAKLKVDIAVIEVGVGGRNDATNVITPLASVITPISFDHMHMLGETIDAIASHKAGIIKEGVPVITAPQLPEALAVLQTEATTLQAPLHDTASEITVHDINHTLTGSTFRLSGALEGSYHTALLGRYQVINTITALRTLQVLAPQFPVSEQQIQKALASVHWAGRLDILQPSPLVIADGAHNEAGFRMLAEFLETFRLRPHLLVGFKKGKNIHSFIEHVMPYAASCTVTMGNFKPEHSDIIQGDLTAAGYEALSIPDCSAALTQTLSQASSEHPLLICGSLYLLGDVYSLWNDLVPHHPVRL